MVVEFARHPSQRGCWQNQIGSTRHFSFDELLASKRVALGFGLFSKRVILRFGLFSKWVVI